MSRIEDPRPSGWIIELVLIVSFIALVVWFWWGPPGSGVPEAPTPLFARSALSVEPVRPDRLEEPTATIASLTFRCNECHRLFESAEVTSNRLTQHEHVVLRHGINDRCFNCHDRDNRDELVIRPGETVPFSEVPRLCGKCHGPTYRDWERGMHGRSMWSWNQRSDAQERLLCSDCHDPHAPAFSTFVPAPGPNTLRMGPIAEAGHGSPVESADPLRKWRPQVHDADGHAEESATDESGHPSDHSPSPSDEAPLPDSSDSEDHS